VTFEQWWSNEAGKLLHYRHTTDEKLIAQAAWKAALEAEPSEPVAWAIYISGEPCDVFMHRQYAEAECARRDKLYPDTTRQFVPLYTAPPRRELSDSEVFNIAAKHLWYDEKEEEIVGVTAFARAILEAAR
jgi:hypothetical protein